LSTKKLHNYRTYLNL